MISTEVISFKEPETTGIDWTKLVQVKVDIVSHLQETGLIDPLLWEMMKSPGDK